ncbi:MAG: SDR family NAD(P)-dependent oxidoreductase [Phycisphaerales bacterium]
MPSDSPLPDGRRSDVRDAQPPYYFRMTIDLRGKPIAITGASSGIGEATAIACAAAGMPVAIAARRLDRLDTLAQQIRQSGGKVFVRELNVADEAASRAFINDAAAELGGLYAVFANAGYGEEKCVHKMPPADLRRCSRSTSSGR